MYLVKNFDEEKLKSATKISLDENVNYFQIGEKHYVVITDNGYTQTFLLAPMEVKEFKSVYADKFKESK